MDAKDEFRTLLARASQFELDLQNPDKIDTIAATPPHLLGRG